MPLGPVIVREADAFLYRLAARLAAPALSDHRLYWEAIADALGGKAKLILDPGEAQRRHLIVPGLPFGLPPTLAVPEGRK